MAACGHVQQLGASSAEAVLHEVRACLVVDVAAVVHDLSRSGIDLLKGKS